MKLLLKLIFSHDIGHDTARLPAYAERAVFVLAPTINE